MPGRGSIASLVVELEANSAKLRTGLDQATKRLDDFGKKVDRIGKTVSAALAFDVAKQAATALASFVKQGADAAAKMGDLAQSVGAPVEQFSKLSYAAQFFGLNADALGSNLGRLNKQMAEAYAGGKDQADLFGVIGVSVTDASGKLRTSGDVLKDISGKFAGMKDGAAKSALAVELFGKSGASMIPFLNKGAEGIAELEAEASRLGLTITGSAYDSATAFNDNLARMRKVIEGVAIRVAADLTPAIANLTSQLLQSKDGSNALDGAVQALSGTFRVLMSAGAVVAGVFEVVGKNIAMTAAAAVAVSQGEFRRAWDIIKDGHGDMLKSIEETKGRIEAIWSTAPSAAAKALDEQQKKQQEGADKLLSKLERLKKAREDEKKAREEAARAAKRAADEARRAEEEALRRAAHIAEINFESRRKFAEIAAGVASRRSAFASAGATSADVFGARTAGFASFDAAMREFSERMGQHQDALDRAEKYEVEGRVDAANAARESAAHFKAMADRAGDAADAFTEVRYGLESMRSEIADKVISQLGPLGDAISWGRGMMQRGLGWASGGQMGADGKWQSNSNAMGDVAVADASVSVISAVLDWSAGFYAQIAARGERLSKLSERLGDVFQSVADGYDIAYGAVSDFAGILAYYGKQILETMRPSLEGMGKTIASFAPVVVAFGESLLRIEQAMAATKVLAPSFEDAPKMLFSVVREFGLTTLRVAKFFVEVKDGIARTLAGVMRDIASFEPVKGWKPFEGLNDTAQFLTDSITGTEGLTEAILELTRLNWDDAKAKADSIIAQLNQTEAVKQATAALTNVPNAWRIALRRYDATKPVHSSMTGIPKFARGGFVDRPTLALVGEGGEGEHITPDSKLRRAIREETRGAGGGVVININGITDPQRVAEKVMEVMRRLNFQRSGSLVAGAPRYAGG